MVVTNELKEPIRSHHDIDRDSAKHFKRASKVINTVHFWLVTNPHPSRSSTRHSPSEFPPMATSSISLLVVSIKLGSLR